VEKAEPEDQVIPSAEGEAQKKRGRVWIENSNTVSQIDILQIFSRVSHRSRQADTESVIKCTCQLMGRDLEVLI
jgi:hypothetical protein